LACVLSSNNNYERNNIESVLGTDLERAINNLRSSLGDKVVNLLMTDLESQGVILGGKERYNLKSVEMALKKTFGQDGGELLMDMISKSLNQKL
jgi:hypothetical protein